MRHMRLHTGERPFICHIGECRRDFLQRNALNRHLMQIHEVFAFKQRGVRPTAIVEATT